jgi:SAM-dependent methyltransferase
VKKLYPEIPAGMSDKSSRDPETAAIYADGVDYITAYSRHTDHRIRVDGPHGAIGANAGEWESYGDSQLAYLKSVGLEPDHTLLDLGCGTGRLARKAAPFLARGGYSGIDISMKAVAHAMDLAAAEGWANRDPSFFVSNDGGLELVRAQRFDFIWAHSVFLHLPVEAIEGLLDELRLVSFHEFHFTIKLYESDKKHPYARRTGLKQFRLPKKTLTDLAGARGFTVEYLGHAPGIAQEIARIVR